MKFAKSLSGSIEELPDRWKVHFISYKELKKQIGIGNEGPK
jgi:hypothetical protein